MGLWTLINGLWGLIHGRWGGEPGALGSEPWIIHQSLWITLPSPTDHHTNAHDSFVKKPVDQSPNQRRIQ